MIGGGIAGIQTALDLARAGIPGPPGGADAVHRRPHEPAGQGLSDRRLLDLNPRSPDDGCRSASPHHAAHAVRGDRTAGSRRASSGRGCARQPRYVDPELCVGCGLCSRGLPRGRGPTPTIVGLKAAKAIDRPFPQAVPATYPHRPRGLPQRRRSCVCERCVDACEPGAIDFDDEARGIDPGRRRGGRGHRLRRAGPARAAALRLRPGARTC